MADKRRWTAIFNATAHPGRKLVIVHLFAKKTRAMPHREIEIAEDRRSDWVRREGG